MDQTCDEKSIFNGEDFCIHCSIPFNQNNEDVKLEKGPLFDDRRTKVSEISSSTEAKIPLTSVLSTLFNLNYLQGFEMENDCKELFLCLHCSTILTNLYQLYNDFHQLGEINSYLSKKLQRLDEIMDSHQQGRINCDLLIHQKNNKKSRRNVSSSTKRKNNSSTTTGRKRSCKSRKSSQDVNFDRQPRIILKKLPADYSQVVSLYENDVGFDNDSVNGFASSNDDDDMDSRLRPEVVLTEEDSSDMDFDGPKSSTSKRTPKVSSQAQDKIKRQSKSKQKEDNSKLLEPKKKASNKHKVKHYLIKKTKSPNPCWYCKKDDFLTPADCVEHTKNEHLATHGKSSDSCVCERCSKICCNDKSLLLHMKRCELIPCGVILPTPFQCSDCPKSFESNDRLQKHLITHTDDRPFVCPECPYRAKSSTQLKAHQQNKHSEPNEDEKMQCDLCGRVMKNYKLFKWHKTYMHTNEGYAKYKERQAIVLAKQKEERMLNATPLSTVCMDCNVDFYSRLALINHRRNFHSDNMGKEHVCEICGKDFNRKYSLTLHLKRVHTDDRPFLCQQCGKGFKTAYNLKAHEQQTHSEEGRLKYNEQMREKNRRMKQRARELATVTHQQQQQQQQQQIQFSSIHSIPNGLSLSDLI